MSCKFEKVDDGYEYTDGALIYGRISWHQYFQQYTFSSSEVVLKMSQLQEIIEFMDKLNKR